MSTEEKVVDKLEIPTCQRCGQLMDEVSCNAVFDNNHMSLGGGIVRMTPVAHQHHFKCQACEPPRVIVTVPYSKSL